MLSCSFSIESNQNSLIKLLLKWTTENIVILAKAQRINGKPGEKKNTGFGVEIVGQHS